MRILKKLLLAPFVIVALSVASAGVRPASFIFWYQPKPPVK
ncbi:MAG: cyclic lactone autoinducer peptide [Syntrophomonadaceae bacterium]|nr:cyclic lactone autoinducer peptide [Syntrophomonadaceae bacterium]